MGFMYMLICFLPTNLRNHFPVFMKLECSKMMAV